MKRVYFDAGHGGSDPGAVKYVREADVAKKVVKAAVAYMRQTYTCEVYEDVTADSTTTISNRANRWGADLFISVHFNAGGGDGYEALVYSASTRKLGLTFEKHVKAAGQNSRGVKYRPDLNVLRSTTMPAILNEVAFVDNKADIADWDEDAELDKMGRALGDAAADYLKLKKAGPQYKATQNLNFRKSPALTAKVIGTIHKGDVLTGTVDANGWLKTTHDGKTGYVRQRGEKVYCLRVEK